MAATVGIAERQDRRRLLSEARVDPLLMSGTMTSSRTVTVGEFNPIFLDLACGAACVRGMSVAEFLRMAIRHETLHAGQLVVIRRLYRQLPSPSDPDL
jgi:hypothetical protein